MGFFKQRKKEQKHCPHCRKPVADGIVFCDACGFRLVPPPACSKCHQPLAPETNFCESCGTPVGIVPAPLPAPDLPVATENSDAMKTAGKSSKAKKSRKKKSPPPMAGGSPDSVTTMAEKISDNPIQEGTPPNEPAYGTPLLSAPAICTKNGVTANPRFFRKTLILTGILVCCLILAIVWMTGSLNGDSIMSLPWIAKTPGHDPYQNSSIPATAGITVAPTALQRNTSALIPGQTRVPPESYQIWIQAERDPVTNIVSVLFDGGKGQRAVREVQARLTRSDGEILTRSFKPTTTGEGAYLQGTKFSDRLEVILHYYNGDQYTVIDKVFEYKMRN